MAVVDGRAAEGQTGRQGHRGQAEVEQRLVNEVAQFVEAEEVWR